MKRKYAKLCIGLFVIGLVILLWAWLFMDPYYKYEAYVFILAEIMILSSLIIKWTLIKCDYCNCASINPQWFGNDNRHCVNCGKIVHWK